MAAEAYNETGDTSEAWKLLNSVRKRAGAREITTENYTELMKEKVYKLNFISDADDAGKFRTALYWERGFELAFEGQRKYDLIRWGIYYDAAHNKLTEATNDKRWTTSGYYKAAKEYAANTEERHQFLPIPMKELGVNLLLKQNSYWSNAAE